MKTTTEIAIHGGTLTVDRADIDLVYARPWYITSNGHITHFLPRSQESGGRTSLYLARLILARKLNRDLEQGEQAITLDGNRSNMSRDNVYSSRDVKIRRVPTVIIREGE